jgi:hypothetical protein
LKYNLSLFKNSIQSNKKYSKILSGPINVIIGIKIQKEILSIIGIEVFLIIGGILENHDIKISLSKEIKVLNKNIKNNET